MADQDAFMHKGYLVIDTGVKATGRFELYESQLAAEGRSWNYFGDAESPDHARWHIDRHIEEKTGGLVRRK